LNWQTPTVDVYTKVKWKPLKEIYSEKLSILAYKYYYGHLPEPLLQYLVKYNSSYNLRWKQTVLLPKPKTEDLKKSAFYQAAVLWNSLENNQRAIENIGTFKSEIQSKD
jgi:hypothetical protein